MPEKVSGPAGDQIQADTALYIQSAWKIPPSGQCVFSAILSGFSNILFEALYPEPQLWSLCDALSSQYPVRSPSFPQGSIFSTCFRAMGFYFPDLVQRALLFSPQFQSLWEFPQLIYEAWRSGRGQEMWPEVSTD